jgi:glycerol-3-phosphate acyltransferase PlsY
MYDWLFIILGFVMAYLLGSIPTAVWVGKWFYGKDIRNEGSGNAGATNTIRILGMKAGIPVIIVDVMKGYLAVYLMPFFMPDGCAIENQVYAQIIAGFIAVVGHALPVFAGFRGGKGVGTLLGVGIALYPVAVWFPVGIFVIILLLSGYVSLASILGAFSFPFVVIFYMHQENPGLIALSIVASLFVLWTHRKNMKRLIKGEENRFRIWKKRKN